MAATTETVAVAFANLQIVGLVGSVIIVDVEDTLELVSSQSVLLME